jgi:hypothetical protein
MAAEPKIVALLRRYLAAMGPRATPIAVTAHQAEQLAVGNYLTAGRGGARIPVTVDLDALRRTARDGGGLWFDGHALRITEDTPLPIGELHAREYAPPA